MKKSIYQWTIRRCVGGEDEAGVGRLRYHSERQVAMQNVNS